MKRVVANPMTSFLCLYDRRSVLLRLISYRDRHSPGISMKRMIFIFCLTITLGIILGSIEHQLLNAQQEPSQTPTTVTQDTTRLGIKIRDLIVGGFIALLFSPLTIFLGYQLNNYLAKDNISIEQVDLLPEMSKIAYPQKEFRELLQLNTFLLYLQYIGASPQVLSAIGTSTDTGTVQAYPSLSKEEVDVMIGLLEGFDTFQKDYQARVNGFIARLGNYKQGDNINDILPWIIPIQPDIFPQYEADPGGTVPGIAILLRREVLSFEMTNERTRNALLLLKNFKPERTGTMQIKLTFLNKGNTDGLVREDGMLVLVQQNLSIPISLSDSAHLPKVEKRSMSQTVFKSNEAKTIKEDYKKFSDFLQFRNSIPCRVELSDIRDKKIRSKELTLPVS